MNGAEIEDAGTQVLTALADASFGLTPNATPIVKGLENVFLISVFCKHLQFAIV